MKLFPFFLLLLTGMGLTSCDPDKDTTTDNSDLLIGTWELESANAVGVSTTTYQDEEYNYNFSSTLIEPSAYFVTFDEKTVSAQGNVTMELTIVYDGQPIIQTANMSDIVSTSSWELSGDRLTFWDETDAESIEIDVITLTETELIMEFDLERTETMNGSTGRQVQTVTYVFSRSH